MSGNTELEVVREQKRQADIQIARLCNDKERDRIRLEEKDAVIAKQEKTVESLHNMISAGNEHEEILEKELSALKERYKRLTAPATADSMDRDWEALISENDRLRRNLRVAEGRLYDSEKRIEELEKNAAYSVEKSNRQVERIRTLEKVNDEFRSRETQDKNNEERIKRLKEERDFLRGRCDGLAVRLYQVKEDSKCQAGRIVSETCEALTGQPVAPPDEE